MVEEKVNLDSEQESDLSTNNALESAESEVVGAESSRSTIVGIDEVIEDDKKSISPKRSIFPSVGDVFALFGMYAFATIITSIIMPFLGISLDSEKSTPQQHGYSMALFSLVIYSLSTIFFLIYRGVRGGKGRIVSYSSRGFNPTLLLWGVILMFAVGIVVEPLLSLFQMPIPPIGRGLWSIVTLCVLAPFFEEFLCRGILLESLRKKYGVWVAFFVSSVFFAVMHFSSVLTINAFFLGMVLAFVYIQSGSIFAPIILHAINNAIAYIIIASGNDNMMLINIMKEYKSGYVIAYITSVAVCLISGYVIVKIVHKLRDEEKKIVTE